jgi:integrase
MAVAKLTKSLIAKLPPGSALWDTEVRGFGCRRQTDGTYFYLRYTIGPQQRMRSIGRFGSPWTVEQARRHALKALGQLVGGDDPFAAKAEGLTFRELAEVYIARQQSRLAASTLRALSLYLRASAKPLANRPLGEITRKDVAACLAVVEQSSGAPSRNRARATLSAFYRWAIEEGHVEANPVQGTGKAAEASRDRVLSDSELAAVWRALPTGSYGDLVRLLILTGQRRQELGGLRWTEVNFNDRLITLPAERCKNGRSHTIPLSEPALAILAARPASSDLVFGTGRHGYNGWSDGKATLDRKLPAGFPPFVHHDLRRSCASGMARLGVNLPTIEKLLNHVSGSFAGIVGVYQRHDFADEKRAALERWAAHMMTVVRSPAGLPLRSAGEALASAAAVA